MKVVKLPLGARRKTPPTLVRGPDRFAHTLLDLMMETYKPVLESLRKQIEALEEGVLVRSPPRIYFHAWSPSENNFSRLKQIVRPPTRHCAPAWPRKTAFDSQRDCSVFARRGTGIGAHRNQTDFGPSSSPHVRLYLSKSGHEANAGIRVLTGITALTFHVFVISVGTE